MIEIQLHTPQGIITIHLETVTDTELAQYGVTRQKLYSSLPDPQNIFNPDTIRTQEILATSPDAITMPEMWELLRIYAKQLGYRFE